VKQPFMHINGALGSDMADASLSDAGVREDSRFNLNGASKAGDACCGEPVQYFWADDGREVGFCRRCGEKFVNTSQLRDSQSPWIGVDLDGTLAKEEENLQPDQIGAPVEAMAKRVKEWVEGGQTVKIFTARASSPRQVINVRAWLKRNGLPDLEVTNIKDYRMIQLWDDRCVRVATNLGEPITTAKDSSNAVRSARTPGVRVSVKRSKPPGLLFSTLRYLFAL
jgi:hypothetical protein